MIRLNDADEPTSKRPSKESVEAPLNTSDDVKPKDTNKKSKIQISQPFSETHDTGSGAFEFSVDDKAIHRKEAPFSQLGSSEETAKKKNKNNRSTPFSDTAPIAPSSFDFKFTLDSEEKVPDFLSTADFGGHDHSDHGDHGGVRYGKQRKKYRTSTVASGSLHQKSRKRSKRHLGSRGSNSQAKSFSVLGAGADDNDIEQKSDDVPTNFVADFGFSAEGATSTLESLQLQCTLSESKAYDLQRRLDTNLDELKQAKQSLDESKKRVKMYQGDPELLGEMNFESLRNLKEDLGKAVKSIDDEMERQLGKTRCVICHTRERDTVFIDGCNHFCVCSECCEQPLLVVTATSSGGEIGGGSGSLPTEQGSPLRNCPICDQQFQNTLQVVQVTCSPASPRSKTLSLDADAITPTPLAAIELDGPEDTVAVGLQLGGEQTVDQNI